MQGSWIADRVRNDNSRGTHAISALGFFSNIKFWSVAGYFDVASHEKWLLHTWSLLVEWQFYLLLPIALWAVWRFKPGRAAQLTAVLAGLVLSLGTAVWITPSAPTAAFFLLHTRAWEMLGGPDSAFAPSRHAGLDPASMNTGGMDCGSSPQ